jgi:hypothetical protein
VGVLWIGPHINVFWIGPHTNVLWIGSHTNVLWIGPHISAVSFLIFYFSSPFTQTTFRSYVFWGCLQLCKENHKAHSSQSKAEAKLLEDVGLLVFAAHFYGVVIKLTSCSPVFAIFTPVLTLRNWTFRKEHK